MSIFSAGVSSLCYFLFSFSTAKCATSIEINDQSCHFILDPHSLFSDQRVIVIKKYPKYKRLTKD